MGIGPEITVTLSSNLIQFEWRGKQLQLEPYVNMDMDKRAPVQIGKNANMPGTILIGVFDIKSELPFPGDKFPFLQMLFEYGIGKMFEQQRLPMLKPLIIIRGVDSLREILGGYQYALIATAFIKAKARFVRFE